MLKIFESPLFSRSCGEKVAYGFYGRRGGVSRGIYSSLNCGPGSGDNPEAVNENRKIVSQDFLSGNKEISTLWQCRTSLCVTIDSPVPQGEDRPKADALVTDCPGLPIGVLTADCGPVLFVAEKKNGAPIIAAAHAGWTGALGGILEATIDAMLRSDARLESIAACVGPCIGASSYEVQPSFSAPFLEMHPEADHFFRPARRDGHLLFDLAGYIAMRLSLVGVRNVFLSDMDTYAREQDCFSFRRSTHKGDPDYGRQLSAIAIPS